MALFFYLLGALPALHDFLARVRLPRTKPIILLFFSKTSRRRFPRARNRFL